jgi:hypothetical protein
VNGCKSGWCQVVFHDQNGYIIETSIAPGPPGPVGRPGPPPGYAGPPGPPPGYVMPPPGYYPPPPGYYPPPYYYGGYYRPYWGWRRHGYWRHW